MANTTQCNAISQFFLLSPAVQLTIYLKTLMSLVRKIQGQCRGHGKDIQQLKKDVHFYC